MKNMAVILALVLALSASRASADVYFSDNFNTENGGVGALNYTGLSQWTVTSGTIDLIGAGTPYDFQPGNGLYLDMDGSTDQAGTIATSVTINLPAGAFQLSFDLAGNLRGSPGPDSVTAQVEVGDLVNATVSLAADVPFTNFVYGFDLAAPQSVQISFAGSGGDNIGMLLDNVVLSSAVPEPVSFATWSLLGLTIGGAGWWRRKRSA